MNVTFYGAVREVTGSMHLLTTGQERILLDCGMFQGRRKEAAGKNRVLPFDPALVSNVVLSHAHVDHCGRIPLLTKNGFSGRVITTRPTADACSFLLRDSAHIQESDAGYLNYKSIRATLSDHKKSRGARTVSSRSLREIKALLKKGRHELDEAKIAELMQQYRLEAVEPLYTVQDAEQSLSAFDGIPYRYQATVGKDVTCRFYEAGHILGSAISIVKAGENGAARTIGFTGDLGRFNNPILKDPCLNFDDGDRELDLLIMESTYGDRLHAPMADMKSRLQQVLTQALARGGSVVIPAFAFGRIQTLLYSLHELYNENAVPRVPVYVDSPLGTNMTKVFGEHPEVYDQETHETFLKKGQNPFSFEQMHFIGSVQESMELNRDTRQHIVISASGMCEAGRILHHLRYRIHSPGNTILLVGYMAHHTLGRRLQEQGLAWAASGRTGAAPVLRVLNKDYPLKAHVEKIDGFSAHADRDEMLRFLRESGLKIKRIALVHGEEDQIEAFAATLRAAGYQVTVPRRGETITV